MGQNKTGGFDLLIQISEAELNEQVKNMTGLPQGEMNIPFGGMGITANFVVVLNTPVVDIASVPSPKIKLIFHFSEAEIEFKKNTFGSLAPIAPVSGQITITDDVEVVSTSGQMQAMMNFQNGNPEVKIIFDPEVTSMINGLDVGIDSETLSDTMAKSAIGVLKVLVQNIPLSKPVDVTDDDDPMTPSGFDVTTYKDGGNGLAFGVMTSAKGFGNIKKVTQNFIPDGGAGLLMLNNDWLLSALVRPKLAAALGLQNTDFDAPLHLNKPVDAPGDSGATLTDLDATVVDDHIEITGRATMSGDGWSAVADFNFNVTLELVNGQIVITAGEPNIDTDVDLAWWVWLTTLGLGAILGGIVGAIIVVVVDVVAESIAESIANNLVSKALNSATSNFPPVPLGPVGESLKLTNLLLDDLELSGSVNRKSDIPVKAQGVIDTTNGFSIDLDNGEITSEYEVKSGTDLIWDPEQGFSTNTDTGLTITTDEYGSITPANLEMMPFESHYITAVNIPVNFHNNELVFGVLTNEGRYSKVMAWKNPLNPELLHMEWITFDRPALGITLDLKWKVLKMSSEGSTSSTGNQGQLCTTSFVSRQCTIEAIPQMVSYPLVYEWFLNDQPIYEGDGEMATQHGMLSYSLNGRFLIVETEMGQPIKCPVCVYATDARAREVSCCQTLERGNTSTTCGAPPNVPQTKPKKEIQPCDPLIGMSNFTSVLSPVFTKQFNRALEEAQRIDSENVVADSNNEYFSQMRNLINRKNKPKS